MNIDWSKAPEWAQAHGIVGGCAMWVGEDSYAYTERPLKTYNWAVCADNLAFRHRSELTSLIERPKAWNGEGAPPVGAQVEYQRRGAPNGKWYPTQINFLSGQHVIFCDSDGDEIRENPTDILFRPLRTPEQIAAEERATGIKEMCSVFMRGSDEGIRIDDCCKRLYDAGYRKP